MPNMEKKITGQLLYQYDACRHWPYYLYNDGRRGRRGRMSDTLLAGDIFDAEAALGCAGCVTAVGRTAAARKRSTLELMRRGERLIRGGLLEAGCFVGEPDLLERRDDGPSDFGQYHYTAVDAKIVGGRLHEGHKLQLAMYGELLMRVQGVRPKECFMAEAPGSLIGLNLEEYQPSFEAAVASLKEIVGGKKPPPRLTSGCRHSPWFKECLADAESTDDIVLLYGIRDSAVSALRGLGIGTVADAAAMDVEAAAGETGLKRRTLERLKIQAEALKEKRHFLRKGIEFPHVPLEIHFDMESSPPRRLDYLFGLLFVEGGSSRYESVIAEGPEDEGAAWREFLARLETLPRDFAVYHYGDYEPARLEALESRYGGSLHLDRFRAAMIDLNEVVKDCIIFPLYFYSLKDIGRYIGFDRSKTIAGGGESVAFYESWLKTGNRAKLKAILKYNEDDCRATLALKEWLLKQGA
jgi:uncharacterized protein